MTYKPINNITDGVFADWEVLNQIINNLDSLSSQIPGLYLNSSKSSSVFTNKEFSAQQGRAKNLKKRFVSIEAGTKEFKNVKDKKTITIDTKINGVYPIVVATIGGTEKAQVYVTGANQDGKSDGKFNLNIVNKGSGSASGRVFWMCMVTQTG